MSKREVRKEKCLRRRQRSCLASEMKAERQFLFVQVFVCNKFKGLQERDTGVTLKQGRIDFYVVCKGKEDQIDLKRIANSKQD